ncbi:MAG: SDR family NAD(P)-dependent oxidoreductase [Bacteroidales bacterium]|nr:SDR family NAD(P)-dependent oxidoreductase [Bacteroidales bacterium]
MDKKTIIVVGAGQGLGNHVAERFGREGYRVVLMARNAASLDQYEKRLTADGIEAHTHIADAAHPETLTEAIIWAKQQFGTPDVLYYNVGITAADDPKEMCSEELMRHFQVDVASAYHCVRLVADDEFAAKRGAIFMTGGGLADYPTAQFIPLSIDKAAIRALAIALHDELKPRGIHVGTLTVFGSIGIDNYMSPARMAETVWQMNQQRDVCELKYEYPDMQDGALTAAEYWTKVYALAEKYRQG